MDVDLLTYEMCYIEIADYTCLTCFKTFPQCLRWGILGCVNQRWDERSNLTSDFTTLYYAAHMTGRWLICYPIEYYTF